MKKIIEVGAYEAETPVNFVEKVFDNEQSYRDYLNDANNQMLYAISSEQPENALEAAGIVAKKVAITAGLIGGFTLLYDATCGFPILSSISDWNDERKLKKFIKKHPEMDVDQIVEQTKARRIDVEKVIEKVRD